MKFNFNELLSSTKAFNQSWLLQTWTYLEQLCLYLQKPVNTYDFLSENPLSTHTHLHIIKEGATKYRLPPIGALSRFVPKKNPESSFWFILLLNLVCICCYWGLVTLMQEFAALAAVMWFVHNNIIYFILWNIFYFWVNSPISCYISTQTR